MGVERALSGPAGDPALPRPRRRPLRPAPRHRAATRAWRRCATTSRARRWHVTTEDGARVLGDVLRHGRRAACRSPHRPAIEGLDDFDGDWYHSARWPHGRRRPRRQARRRDRHRLDRHPADPAARRAGGAPVRVPADAELQHARAQPAARPRRRSARSRPTTASAGGSRASRSAACRARIPRRCRSARRSTVAPEERRRAYEDGWASGGIGGVTLAFNDIIIERRGERHGRRLRARQDPRDRPRPGDREALCPTTHPIGTKRICVDTDYFATFNRDDVTLVDVRTRPDRAAHRRAASQTASAEYELDVIVFATGFDAMTGAVLDIDVRGRDGGTLTRQVVGRAAHLPRARDRRLSQPVPRHRPGQPLGAEQHGRVDRAARRLDRGLRRPPARARARHDRGDAATPRTPGSRTSTRSRRPRCSRGPNSWYAGANIPGKPRVFMPYLGGVGAYRTHCDGRRRERLRGLRDGGGRARDDT